MSPAELDEKLRTEPGLGVTLRLVNGMDTEEIWRRAQEWAAQQEAEWAARTAQEFTPAPIPAPNPDT